MTSSRSTRLDSSKGTGWAIWLKTAQTARELHDIEIPIGIPYKRCSEAAAVRIINGSADRAAMWNGSMNTVLDEVTSEAIDAKHIRRRIDNWEERLNGLYRMIGGWLPDGWGADEGEPVLMNEKLMQKFGVSAKRMPALELRDRAGQVVRFEPYGLWIIGNNGRVDVKRDGHRYFIVDAAENFEEPDWQVVRADQRCDREAVTRDWLIRFLQ